MTGGLGKGFRNRIVVFVAMAPEAQVNCWGHNENSKWYDTDQRSRRNGGSKIFLGVWKVSEFYKARAI